MSIGGNKMQEVEKNFIDCCHRYHSWYKKGQEVMKEREEQNGTVHEVLRMIHSRQELEEVRTFLQEEVNLIKPYLKKESFYRLGKVQELIEEEFYFEELDLEGMLGQVHRKTNKLEKELSRISFFMQKAKEEAFYCISAIKEEGFHMYFPEMDTSVEMILCIYYAEDDYHFRGSIFTEDSHFSPDFLDLYKSKNQEGMKKRAREFIF